MLLLPKQKNMATILAGQSLKNTYTDFFLYNYSANTASLELICKAAQKIYASFSCGTWMDDILWKYLDVYPIFWQNDKCLNAVFHKPICIRGYQGESQSNKHANQKKRDLEDAPQKKTLLHWTQIAIRCLLRHSKPAISIWLLLWCWQTTSKQTNLHISNTDD